MSELFDIIGTAADFNLLADPQGADPIAVSVEPGNGKIGRGTLLYRKASGMYAPAASGQISTSYNVVVLNEDVDSGDTVAAAPVAETVAAFRAGRFVNGK